MPTERRPGKLTKDKKTFIKVARDLARSNPKKVAEKYGVHPSAITKFKTREDVQAIIRAESEKLLDLVPDVREFYRDVLREGKRVLFAPVDDQRERANNIKLVGEAVKVGDSIGKATGLLPSHLGNLTVNQAIFSDSPSLSPVLLSLLSRSVPSVSPSIPVESIEVEYGEEGRKAGGEGCGGDLSRPEVPETALGEGAERD